MADKKCIQRHFQARTLADIIVGTCDVFNRFPLTEMISTNVTLLL